MKNKYLNKYKSKLEQKYQFMTHNVMILCYNAFISTLIYVLINLFIQLFHKFFQAFGQ